MKKIFLTVIICLSFTVLIAQIKQISGSVTSKENGQPLAGCSILAKGTKTSVVTNEKGQFTISVTEKVSVLVVTTIGYVASEVSIEGKSTLSIQLITEIKELDDVVVVGYASVKRKDLTGSVSSVSAKQLKDVPMAATAQALQGRLAGVQIISTDGAPGAEMVVRVRGGSSITQDIAPLYIVDGVQVEDALSTLSLQDIASIDVLKDASTTAIYGARGANGVFLITTKGGKAGKTQVTYSGSFGTKKIPQYLNVMQPYEFVTTQWERSRGSSTDSASFAQTYGSTWDTLNVYKNIPFINWQEKVFGRSAKFQNHNLSINGGNKETTYNLSFTNNKEEGIQLESGLTRNIINFKIETAVTDRFKIGLTTRYIDQVIDGKGTIDPGTRESSRMRHSINYRPFELDKPGYGEDEFDLTYQQNSRITNPVLMTKSEYKKNTSKGIYFSAFANYNISKNLVWRSTFGMDNINIRTDQFWDKLSSTASRYANLPVASIGQQQNNTLSNSNTLQFTKNNYKDNHDFSVLGGMEIVEQKSKQNTIETRYFPSDIEAFKALANMGLGSIPSGSTAQQPMPTSYEGTPQRIFSIFSRISYAFKDRYLATFNIRSDRSSKFTPENSQLISPSGSIGWRFSKEKFMQNISWISDAKIRYGYGQVGNNRIGNNLYLQLYGVSASYALNHAVLPGFVPTALSNPELAWEKNITRNFGLDLSLFNDKVQFTMDIYKNTASNLLLNVKIPTTTGYTDQIQNVGSISNSGVEFQISANPIKTKSFNWTSNFNVSLNKNRIESLGGVNDITKTSGWQVGGEQDYIVRVGMPVGQMFGYTTDGWYKIDDFDYNATTKIYTLKTGVASNQVQVGFAPQPGTLKFKDLNGDGFIDDQKDKTIIGDANSIFSGGWNNQFTFGQFDMSIFINFVVGNDIYNANKIEFTNSDFVNINNLALNNGRWKTIDGNGVKVTDPVELTKLNANATIWRPNSAQRWPLHTWAIEDGSFIRISNVTVGYTLSNKILSKMKISNFRFFGTVNNLLTITNYSGFDPDVNARRSDPLTPGVDFAGYPQATIWTFGLNVTF